MYIYYLIVLSWLKLVLVPWDIQNLVDDFLFHECQLSKVTNPTMHLSHIPQCTIQNSFVLNGALWDMGRCIVGFVRLIYFLFSLLSVFTANHSSASVYSIKRDPMFAEAGQTNTNCGLISPFLWVCYSKLTFEMLFELFPRFQQAEGSVYNNELLLVPF